MIKKLINRILYPNTCSRERYIRYLKKAGVTVGERCVIYSPKETMIDLQRPHMLSIGDHVLITRGVTILTHDYSRAVFYDLPAYGNVGEAGITRIGNNVFIGMNATILMGAQIGDNSIVGAGAVVSGVFPPDSVIAGNPARVVATLETFYRNRKAKEIAAAKSYVKEWRRTFGRDPSVRDMTDAFSWLYLPHDADSWERYGSLICPPGADREACRAAFLGSEPAYESFEEVVADC